MKASSQKQQKEGTKKKVNIVELRKIVAMSPLDMFLYTNTLDLDFYTDQILPNDSQERVILYTTILASICRLELPGFHRILLLAFSKNICLQEHFRLLVAKLFCKRFKDMWKQQNDMESFLANMEQLLTQSFNAEDAGEDDGNAIIKDILSILERSDNDMTICKKYIKQLKGNLQETLNKRLRENYEPYEIFPSIEDLVKPSDIAPTNPSATQQYLAKHMEFLKEDFLLPLRDCVKHIKRGGVLDGQLPDNFYVFENVFIVLNEQFLDANRHELLFVDVLGTQRDLEDSESTSISWELQEKLWKIKSGSLLCFTTSKEFDNLILATVTYTSQECLKEGFVSFANILCIAKVADHNFLYHFRLV